MSDEAQGMYAAGNADGKYTVVARRYRPRSFKELVGQDTVSQALATAIRTGRVGHAYLFTGARGVGKTSTARIFAKALNAPGGPSVEPDSESDVAQAIDAGSDMDVIEIDGASNRGIEEIRQLRANVNVRPSRSRYKIYIIDEVHMLTTPAFNALLKTLEEPPEHVKFIFCTTDPEKIPITVLSRCQRFDFSPVKMDEIYERLRFICQQENAIASEDALRIVARRAAGSMRDSQSLLEQLLSFSGGQITVEKVHEILGTADEAFLAETCRLLIARDGAGVLRQLDHSISSGMDPGQFGEQLLGYLRDLMAISVGASADILRTANPNSLTDLTELAKAWGTSTILAAIQILDDSLVKMRHSVQGRVLVEVAMIQICQLQDLQRISDLIAQLQAYGEPAAAPKAAVPPRAVESRTVEEKKKDDSTLVASSSPSLESSLVGIESKQAVAPTLAQDPVGIPDAPVVTEAQSPLDEPAAPSSFSEPASPPTVANTSSNLPLDVPAIWGQALQSVDAMVADYARLALRAESIGNDKWRIVFPIGSELAIEYCEAAENRRIIQEAVRDVSGRDIQVSFIGSTEPPLNRPLVASPVRAQSSSQRMRTVAEHPYIKLVCAEFGGEIVRVDAPSASAVPRPKTLQQEQAPQNELARSE